MIREPDLVALLTDRPSVGLRWGDVNGRCRMVVYIYGRSAGAGGNPNRFVG